MREISRPLNYISMYKSLTGINNLENLRSLKKENSRELVMSLEHHQEKRTILSVLPARQSSPHLAACVDWLRKQCDDNAMPVA